MGRKSFFDMKIAWPPSDDDYAKPMNAIPKAYFSKTDKTEGANVEAAKAAEKARAEGKGEGDIESWNAAPRLTGDLAEEIRKLKAEDGKPIIAWGGAGFARSLIPTGLIDEYQFLVHPVALGQGKDIFSGLKAPLKLKLVALERFGNDVLAKTFHPA